MKETKDGLKYSSEWMVQIKGKWRGRTGLATLFPKTGWAFVQFGAGGPFQWMKISSLHKATKEEIALKTGER